MKDLTYKEQPSLLDDIYKLTDLHVSFISTCKQGANPGALVMLKKEQLQMADNDTTQKNDVAVSVDFSGLSNEIAKGLKDVLIPLVKKEEIDPNVIIDSVQAVVSTTIEKMGNTVNDELKKQINVFQKELEEMQANKVDKTTDEIIEISGKTFKKSDMGNEAFAAISEVYKSNLQLQKEMEHKDLIARVEKEYPHVTGTPDQKAALLNVINHAEKEAREMGLQVLKALNDLSGTFSDEIGENGIQKTTENFIKAVTDTDASLKLDKMAEELAAREGITKARAYLKVCSTPEGEALYNQHISNK